MPKLKQYRMNEASQSANEWVVNYLFEKMGKRCESTREICRNIGISRWTLDDYRNGKTSPQINTLAAVAAYFGDEFLIIPLKKGGGEDGKVLLAQDEE